MQVHILPKHQHNCQNIHTVKTPTQILFRKSMEYIIIIIIIIIFILYVKLKE